MIQQQVVAGLDGGPKAVLREQLAGGRRQGLGNVAAAGLGVATPFCSCSAVPLFIGFVSAGVPLGITMSFLIASPMVNEVAVVLLQILVRIGKVLGKLLERD
mgnify:CR=1 FL=1